MRRFITKKFGEELKAQTLGMGPEYSSHMNAEQTVSPVGVFSDQGPGQSTLQWHSAPPPTPVCGQWPHVYCGHGGWGGAYL